TTSRSRWRRSCRSTGRAAPASAEWCSSISISTIYSRKRSARRCSARPPQGGDHVCAPPGDPRLGVRGLHRECPCACLSRSRESARRQHRQDRERGAPVLHPGARAEVHDRTVALERRPRGRGRGRRYGESQTDRHSRERAAGRKLQGLLEGPVGRRPPHRRQLRVSGEAMSLAITRETSQRSRCLRSTLRTVAVLLALSMPSVHAGDYRVGSLDIAGPWSRATPKGASVGAGYLTIKNTGTTADRLVGGSSDAAAAFEVHEMSMNNGVMKMRPVKGGLEIKPGETVEL